MVADDARPAQESLDVATLVAAGVAALRTRTDTPRLDAELLVAAAAGCGRSAVVAFPERTVPAGAVQAFHAALRRRADGEPLAYVLGEKEFFSLVLAVTPDVLIPRPETELLVEELLARVPRGARAAVLDLGTGSGALALAIKHHRPEAAVTGADASVAALAVARANGRRLDLNVAWRESTWFEALGDARYEAIVCNPPYVESSDPALAEALAFEPRAALDGGPDGLAALRRVLADAARHLAPGGLLLLEHGAEQRPALLKLAAAQGFEVLAACADLAGRARALVLRTR